MTVLIAGDSFTYGSELKDRDNVWWKHIWPDATCVAKPGASTQEIVRRVLEYKGKVDLLVVMFTFGNRFEFRFNIDTGHPEPWLTIGTLEEPKEIEHFTEMFMKYVGTDELYQAYTSWKEIQFLEMVCREHGINYVFTHADRKLVQTNMLPLNTSRWFNVEQSNAGFLNWAIDKEYERGPDLHPLDQAHIDYAEIMKTWLGSKDFITELN